jgi:hypothetical protein
VRNAVTLSSAQSQCMDWPSVASSGIVDVERSRNGDTVRSATVTLRLRQYKVQFANSNMVYVNKYLVYDCTSRVVNTGVVCRVLPGKTASRCTCW